ncbi:MAG: UbiA family prenyltransferase [Candidatus Aenigmarchaeota archaeon]|nr:UbiA family prenyltransferase [Candidatus Aenigmarchaeota archaeon]
MQLNKIFYMLYPVHFPRNFLQFLISVILFYSIFGQISLESALIGGIAFTLSYQFTYALNDAIDYKYDIKDKSIIKKKLALHYPLHSGVVKTKELLLFSSAVFVIGTLLASKINLTFFTIQMSLLIFTFFHSNPFFRIKKFSLLLYANMIVIQFIKFSLGWFTQTTTFESFPFWLFVLLSSFYVLVYRIYKSHFSAQFSLFNISNLFVISILIISFIFSLLLYKMPLAIGMTTLFGLFCYYYSTRLKSLKQKMQIGMILIYIMSLFAIISIILVRTDSTLYSVNYNLIQALNEFSKLF